MMMKMMMMMSSGSDGELDDECCRFSSMAARRPVRARGSARRDRTFVVVGIGPRHLRVSRRSHLAQVVLQAVLNGGLQVAARKRAYEA